MGDVIHLGERLIVVRDQEARRLNTIALRKKAYSIQGRGRRAEQRVKRLQRSVSWADKKAIARIYREAYAMTLKTGKPHEVDHIIPLQGEAVCGLHVETNLRIVPKLENRLKSNRFDPVVGDAGIEPATSTV